MASLVNEQGESELDGIVVVPHVLIRYPLRTTKGSVIEHQIEVPEDNDDLAEEDLNEENCNFLLANLCLQEHNNYISGFLIINNKHFFGYGRKKRVKKGANPLHVETTMMLTLLKVVKNKSIENISSLRLYSTLQPCCMCSLVIHQVVAKIKQIQSVDHIDCKVYYGVVDQKMIKYNSRFPNLGDQSQDTKFNPGKPHHKTQIWNHNCVPSNNGKKLCIYSSNQMFDQMLVNDEMLTYAIDFPEKEKASNKSWGFYNTLKDLFSTKVLIHDQVQLVVGEDGRDKLSTLRVDAPAFVPMSEAEEEKEEKKEDKKTEHGPKYGYDRTLNNEVIFQYLNLKKPPKANHGKLFNFVNAMNLTTEKDNENIFWMFLPGNLNCGEGQIEIREQRYEQEQDSKEKSMKNISKSIHNYCNLKAFYWNNPTSLLSMSHAPPRSPNQFPGEKKKKKTKKRKTKRKKGRTIKKRKKRKTKKKRKVNNQQLQ